MRLINRLVPIAILALTALMLSDFQPFGLSW